ncbi:hypothetical protein ANN_05150 [Periplaneta americana]|uniref:Transposase n=1 Tax=Periplaneta americana TaxID=6978 RepID=A0ABQ8TC32_PERAM|nr:hypothetical protein ANN_05150 [Periplaneta americana]
MSPRSSTESYPAFAHSGLRENPGKNLNQVTCPDRESNPGHLVSRPDALTVTPQMNLQIAHLRQKSAKRQLVSDLTNSAVPASTAAEETVNAHSESTTSVMSSSSEIEEILNTSIHSDFQFRLHQNSQHRQQENPNSTHDIVLSDAIDLFDEDLDKYNDDQVFNTDECGFHNEKPFGRTLERQVYGVVQSKGATTHSYTITQVVSKAGKLMPKLLLILEEPKEDIDDCFTEDIMSISLEAKELQYLLITFFITIFRTKPCFHRLFGQRSVKQQIAQQTTANLFTLN